jgi:hypothetical protein
VVEKVPHVAQRYCLDAPIRRVTTALDFQAVADPAAGR